LYPERLLEKSDGILFRIPLKKDYRISGENRLMILSAEFMNIRNPLGYVGSGVQRGVLGFKHPHPKIPKF
jgi:hypothetical protein